MHVLSCCQQKQSVAAKAAIAELECCEGCLQTAHTLCGYTAQFIHVEQVLLSQEFIRAAAAQSKSSDFHTQSMALLSHQMQKA